MRSAFDQALTRNRAPNIKFCNATTPRSNFQYLLINSWNGNIAAICFTGTYDVRALEHKRPSFRKTNDLHLEVFGRHHGV